MDVKNTNSIKIYLADITAKKEKALSKLQQLLQEELGEAGFTFKCIDILKETQFINLYKIFATPLLILERNGHITRAVFDIYNKSNRLKVAHFIREKLKEAQTNETT
jgi:hypothetical protein